MKAMSCAIFWAILDDFGRFFSRKASGHPAFLTLVAIQFLSPTLPTDRERRRKSFFVRFRFFSKKVFRPIPVFFEKPLFWNLGVNVMITIFGDFLQFFGEKIGAFLKNQCYDPFFSKSGTILNKKRQSFRQFMRRKYIF
jgi:hypothetical protein